MDTQTQDGLDKSKAFLADSLEMAHLILKQQLEAFRAGEEVDWRAVTALIKEGRTTARQINQIASNELRDRALKLREKKAAEKESAQADRPKQKPKKAPKPEDREKFIELSTQWLGELGNAVQDPSKLTELQYPPELMEMFKEYGLDPGDQQALETLGHWLAPEAAA